MEKPSKSLSGIKPLEKHFFGKGEVRNFEFTQLYRSQQAFIYEVNTGDQIQYEIFKRVVNKRFACESFPTSKAFGIWAWTYMTLEAAIEKFKQLNSCD